MGLRRHLVAAVYLLMTGLVYTDQADAGLVGVWEFESAGNLTAATIGSDLTLTGTEAAGAGDDGSHTGVALVGDNSYYTVTHGIAANGSGNCVNEYTLLMDINYPASSAGNWLSLWQTNTANTNDGDLFIHTNQTIGVGAAGYSSNTTVADTWYRMVLSVDNGSHWRLYMDGGLWVEGTAQPVDGRFALESVFHVLADDDGDEDPVNISNLALWDEALDGSEIAALSVAGAPIPESPIAGIRVGPFLQSATTTGIWIVWETDTGEESRVDYGLTLSLGDTAFGDAIPGQGAAWIHRTELTDLSPDTYYYYRVSTDTMASDVHHFHTPPAAAAEQSFRFAVYSDTQIDAANPTIHFEVINDGIIDFVTENFGADMSDELAFVLNPGDLVDDGTVYLEWETDFFDPAQNLYQDVPLYPAIGNHERDSHWYFDYLVLPDNGTAGFEEHWYYTDYGNVRVIGLDSNSDYRIQQQLDWLDTVLADAGTDPSIDFVFAQLHHPHKSEVWIPGEIDYTGQVVERLEQFSTTYGKPSIHFFGHTHAYSRGQSRDHHHLWVNAASGGGNIDYWGEYPQADYPEFQVSQPEWGFVFVEVDAGSSPQFRLRRVSRGNEVVPRDNEITDDITIRLSNLTPGQPVGVYPTMADSPVDPDALTLQASAYSDPDADDHLEAHYQITAVSGDYSDPIADEWIRAENWYSPPGATGMANGYYSVNTVTDPDTTHVAVSDLPGNQTLYWRVRYRDDGLVWSPWSAETAFTTGAAAYNFGPNLLVNPGAEDGVSDWTVVDPPLESLLDGECGTETSPVSGDYFFAVGGVCTQEGPYGEAYQAVDVSGDAAAIDDDRAVARFSGYLKNFAGQDRPEIWLVFLDALSQQTGTTAKLAGTVPSWTAVEETVDIPVGTRSIEFHMSGTRLGGADNDCYLDDLVLRIGISWGLGDLNCDGDVDNFDIDPFVLALTSASHPTPFDDYYAAYPACDPMLADSNDDGTVNNFDIDPFVQLLTGP